MPRCSPKKTTSASTDHYAQKISVAIQQAGFNGSDIKNQYLGYHFGAPGATNLLRADPNASSASVLGPKATAANSQKIADRTVGQLLDLIYQPVAKQALRAVRSSLRSSPSRAEAQTYGKSPSDAARLQSVQEQLNADREAGGRSGSSSPPRKI